MNREIILERVKKAYDDGKSVFEWVTEGFQNQVIKCIRETETIYIRITNSTRRSIDMLHAEIEWLKELYEQDLHVPLPVKPTTKTNIEEYQLDDITWYMIGFSEVTGVPLDVTNTSIWNTSLFEEWGLTLGRIHVITPNKELKRPHFLEDLTLVSETIEGLTKIGSPKILSRLHETLSSIKELPRTKETFGLIHNDFHQGNLLFNKGEIGVIDFDECVYGWYAQDIAVSLYHAYWQATEIGQSDPSFAKEFLESFFSGYQKVRMLSPNVIDQIPLFLKWRELFLYALFLKNWPMDSLEEWQKHTIAGLEQRILSGERYITL